MAQTPPIPAQKPPVKSASTFFKPSLKDILKPQQKAAPVSVTSSNAPLLSAANIARTYYSGDIEKAYNSARQRIKVSAEQKPMVYWIAGLSAWRLGEFDDAGAYFERAAINKTASTHFRAAAAYWAARSHMRSGEVRKVSQWLGQANQYPQTFYGILAKRTLGLPFDSSPSHNGSLKQWINDKDYKVIPELVYAIVSQESKFKPHVTNPSGAAGLMQIIPTTASFVTGNDAYKTPEGRALLLNPVTNLKVGQQYLAYLLKYKGIDGNLLNMLVAYNAGPGNFKKWTRRMPDVDDGLMFIESIPAGETRAYVERVLTGYWQYRAQNKKPLTTVEALVAGQPVLYPDYKDLRFASKQKTL